MSGEIFSTGLKLIKQPKADFTKFSLSRLPNILEGRYTNFYMTNSFATTKKSFAFGTNYELQIRYKITNFQSYNAVFGVHGNGNNKHIGIQFHNNVEHRSALWVGVANSANDGWVSTYADNVILNDNEFHTLNVKRIDTRLIATIDDVTVIDVNLSNVTHGTDVYTYSYGTNYSFSYDFDGWIDWFETFIKVNDEVMFGVK